MPLVTTRSFGTWPNGAASGIESMLINVTLQKTVPEIQANRLNISGDITGFFKLTVNQYIFHMLGANGLKYTLTNCLNVPLMSSCWWSFGWLGAGDAEWDPPADAVLKLMSHSLTTNNGNLNHSIVIFFTWFFLKVSILAVLDGQVQEAQEQMLEGYRGVLKYKQWSFLPSLISDLHWYLLSRLRPEQLRNPQTNS